MIDPINITFYGADEAKLQEFLLFGLFVAGKNANTAAKTLDRFIGDPDRSQFLAQKPFDRITNMMYNYKSCSIRQHLINCRTGQYSRLEKALNNIFYYYEGGYYHFNDLKNISLDELMQVHGIGRKTANYFLLYTRKDYRGAALDTHLLKYLRDLGYDAPKTTPTSERSYRYLESLFLEACADYKLSAQEVDLEVWKYYAGREFDKKKIPYFARLK